MIRRLFRLLPLITLILIALWYAFLYEGSFTRLFISADAQGQKLQSEGRVDEALKVYEDRLSIGAIHYRRGEFKKALQAYEQSSSKEAFFNRGNTLVMMGKYKEAIENYSLVLQADPSNLAARENRELAKLRQAELDKYKNTSEGTSEVGADKVVYDNKSGKGDEYKESGSGLMPNQKWLDRLETSPGGFLKSKFLYQYEMQKKGKK